MLSVFTATRLMQALLQSGGQQDTSWVYSRYSRPELLRRFKPSVMLHRIDWSIISAFQRTEVSSHSGVKQSNNTEQMHHFDKGTATVREFANYKPTRHNGVLSQKTWIFRKSILTGKKLPKWLSHTLVFFILLGRLKTACHSYNRP